jgi:isopenicillin-N epimerase
MPSPWADLWSLDPTIDFLNHGSFGACPRAVIEEQRRWQRRLERDPVRFVVYELEAELDRVRAALAGFVDADPLDLVFVPNATTGVNTVLACFPLAPGDEILITNHGYGACKNAAWRAAERAGARVVTAEVPFPLSSERAVIDAVLAAVSERTRLALFDHVTSPTALIFPVNELVRALRARGVVTLVDGAHAPGMLALSVREIDADYYTGNLHKWCCAPKGVGFLWVPKARQAGLTPLVTSHGARSPRSDRTRFLLEFDWTGTSDPSGLLSVPFALDYLGGMFPGGFPALRERNRALALAARQTIARALDLQLPCPDSMIGSMATLPLREDPDATLPVGSPFVEPLYSRLANARFQVVVSAYPALPARTLRLSAHLYNDLAQFERLARVLASDGETDSKLSRNTRAVRVPSTDSPKGGTR